MDTTVREKAAGHRPAVREQALFEELTRQHYAGVYNYLCYMSREQALAEDLTQETFMLVWQHLPELRQRQHAQSWIYRIARNQFLQHRRRAGLDTISLGDCNEVYGGPLPETDPQLMLERDALQETVHRAVEELPDHYREVIVLYNLEHFSLAQIAAVLEVPIGTVKSRRAKAVAALRRVLQQEMAGDEV